MVAKYTDNPNSTLIPTPKKIVSKKGKSQRGGWRMREGEGSRDDLSQLPKQLHDHR
jgi:hypothetical protein